MAALGAQPARNFPEPLAIIGMSCRFAGGAASPDAFWKMLVDGRDAISEVSPERWEEYARSSPENAAALARTTRYGGFLADIRGFDAEFFAVPPREAELMDPQQRIMLEVVWEALEHAGIPPTALAGTDTGVFVGVGSDDYGRRLLEDLPGIEAWTGIGAAMCAVANRISYALDLRGSSFAVDTACSSSLVALHQAALALASGEAPLAIVGGVNVMAGPGLTMVLDAAGAISPDGRCKSFDAGANGYGRGEGAGALVLKRLADARRDGDRVLAVIRGSAVNQDGRTNGIMAPSAEAQTHLLRQAYRVAGIDPATVGYVEAHGTGTRAGDPVEAQALAAVFGAGRPADAPCLIGSVKSNIGHLEAGSGVAGVIKAVLALRHGELPPSLNFHEPNPAIPWATAGLRVVDSHRDWPHDDGDHPRRAGVSGYGYGGTIAHVILEQAPDAVAAPVSHGEPGPAAVFPISSATENGLRATVQGLADWLADADREVSLASVGHTLANRRAHMAHRAAVVAADRDELVARLRDVAADNEPDGVAVGRPLGAAVSSGAVFVFSGHGSQWLGMGRELLRDESVFAAVLDEITPIFAAELGVTPRQVLGGDRLSDVDIIQPMIFAVQAGLTEVWRAHGVTPTAVIGHSVGEIAAAYCAGALDLHDAAYLVSRRSALLRRVAGHGAMAMVDLPFAQVELLVAGRSGVTAAIAAAPSSTVVAGAPDAVNEVCRDWTNDGRMVRRVASDVAFHSPQMDPLLADLVAAADTITPRTAKIRLYSTALDNPRSSAMRDGRYWAANLRNPVRFATAVAAAVDDGHRLFLEVSSHPVVAHSIAEVLTDLGVTDGFVTGTLRRNRPERATLLTNLAALHCHGLPIDLGDAFRTGELADLPSTAWQHRPYWRDTTSANRPVVQRHDVAGRTLLGGMTAVPGTTPLLLWQTQLDHTCRPYPGDHPVQGTEIIPAAVLLNTFLSAAQRSALADVALRVPVSVAAPRDVQVSLQDGTLRLSSRLTGETAWLTHTTALAEVGEPLAPRTLDPRACHERCAEALAPGFVIDRLASIGVAAMGFPWRVEDLRRADGAELCAVVAAGGDAPEWASVLDAALSIASIAFAGSPTLRMPAAIGRVAIGGECPERVLIRAVVADGPAGTDTVDVDIATPDGLVVAEFRRLRYGVLEGDPGAAASPQRLVHEMAWRPITLEAGHLDSVVLVTGDRPSPIVAPIVAALRADGMGCHIMMTPDRLDDLRNRPTANTAVLVVPPATTEPTGDAAVTAGWLLAATAQHIARWPGTDRPRLWAVTAGVRHGGTLDSLRQSPLWGMGRIIGGEHPDVWGGVVDLDPADLTVSAARLPAALRAWPGEDVVALDTAGAHVTRLVAVDRTPNRVHPGCRLDATYLITGGLGVLGLETARWLAGRGARRIMLVSRRGLPPREMWDTVTDPALGNQIAEVRALEALGVTVTVVAADITDVDDARAALDPAALGLPPIRGIVHAAGVLDNRMLADLDRESLRTVLAPKATGVLVLHELFPPGSVDFIALFSSCGYLLGLPGQASYGSANAFLDAFAAYRNGDTVSLGWTSWRGLGMSTSSELIDLELNARGTADITATDAFASWDYIDSCAGHHFAVFRPIPPDPGQSRPHVLTEVTAFESATQPEETTTTWSDLDPDELRDRLLDEVRCQVAGEIRTDPAELDLDRPLTEMGLDSVMTMVIRRRLEKTFRLTLPPTLLWNHPTVTAIAAFLTDELTAAESAELVPAVVA
jgi:6-methylsalicylic acid synthase